MIKRIVSPPKYIFILMSMLLLFMLTSCSDKVEQPSSVTGTTGTQPQAPEEKKLYRIGETAKTDEMEITVTKVERAKEWTKTPAEGFEYVVFSILTKNISSEEQSVTASEFGYVMDDTGNRGSYETYTGVETEHDYSASMEPGDSVEISVVFSVPIEMTRIEFHYTVGYSLEPALRFELNK